MSGKLPSESVSEEVPLNVLATNSTLPNNPSPTSIGALNGDHQEPNRDNAEDEPRVIVFPDARVDIVPIEAPQPPDHTLRRKLEGKHIFMIAINGTLGTGLYVRSGQILELGGPVAVIMSFIFLGILTWAVMQCIAEMLCLWPIPGAIPVFVRKFVDKELGDTVGVAYWYTYSIGFSALIATSASVLNYWTADVEGFTEGFVFIALPVTLVIINAVKVEIYGWIEVVTGVIKMAFLAIIIICLAYIIINCWRDPFTYDTDAAKGWFEALIWLESEECPKSDEDDKKGFTFSPFVIIARSSEIYGLHNAFNAFIVFTALTCANTNLYVASRTLFGVTRNIRSADAMPRVLSWFGVTNNNGVPIRAMTFTALAFCWVPFLQKKETFNTGSDIGEMGSVSIIIIWACLCLAYIRFYHCIHKFDDALAEAGINLARHRREHKYESYPYQSHWQPLLAYLALAGCLVILIVFNGVFLWKKFNVIPFLSGYLTSWSLWVGLDAAAVEELIKDLNALRDKSLEQPPRVSRPLWVSIKGYFRRET
ncbi:hypothetical protein FGSG_09152 [Fusarium graminearum PH-1]|uniref:hypothetical protein n=1 Tax=Gibberella zeae (strain ATCC MYA-4620 / CBS 123657 / FGSC 9075 / NRRL 31084 / PH-1) TaxID=229533 RepID=UPI00021F1ED8|nr:hypothetical protein FGSG_09152 [Fusarium graminearum PH-1]ESU15682.1 hypothetical protein FGSG_09152 [Fusarium graminearum PH-1]|eukprot:XP_011328634.1 hypothetical protein FGSG_09152 [Fusarium graminearum PH-1]